MRLFVVFLKNCGLVSSVYFFESILIVFPVTTRETKNEKSVKVRSIWYSRNCIFDAEDIMKLCKMERPSQIDEHKKFNFGGQKVVRKIHVPATRNQRETCSKSELPNDQYIFQNHQKYHPVYTKTNLCFFILKS